MAYVMNMVCLRKPSLMVSKLKNQIIGYAMVMYGKLNDLNILIASSLVATLKRKLIIKGAQDMIGLQPLT